MHSSGPRQLFNFRQWDGERKISAISKDTACELDCSLIAVSIDTMEFTAKAELMDPNHLRMAKSIRATVKTITTERGGLSQISQNHHLNGTFKQLCNKNMFAEVLFPGTSAEVLEGLPKNLKEILEWSDLELDYTKIAKNAAEVLENIKKKGKANGDIMDETTENVLLPQIGQEALSKGEQPLCSDMCDVRACVTRFSIPSMQASSKPYANSVVA